VIIPEFSCIVADPPWMEKGGGKIKRGADRHYPLMHREEILDTILRSPLYSPAEDAHLYMWVTNNFLLDGLEVMRRMGFTYKTNLVWAKSSFGLGYYFRGKHELCLFGVKGKGSIPRTEGRSCPSLFEAPKAAHSVKPDRFYEVAEARTRGPRLELFARTPRPGWWSWGGEVEGDELVHRGWDPTGEALSWGDLLQAHQSPLPPPPPLPAGGTPSERP